MAGERRILRAKLTTRFMVAHVNSCIPNTLEDKDRDQELEILLMSTGRSYLFKCTIKKCTKGRKNSFGQGITRNKCVIVKNVSVRRSDIY